MPQAPTANGFKSLRKLASELLAAKAAESIAKQARIAVEHEMAALVPGNDESQRTISLADGTRITVKRGLIYSADLDEIEKLALDPPIKSKTVRELDLEIYRWYRDNDPKAFSEIARHVETKPRKILVTVKAPK